MASEDAVANKSIGRNRSAPSLINLLRRSAEAASSTPPPPSSAITLHAASSSSSSCAAKAKGDCEEVVPEVEGKEVTPAHKKQRKMKRK